MIPTPEKKIRIPLRLINHFRKGELIIVDVRSPMEFIHGHIDGARNIPFETINLNVKVMRLWKKPIILCSTNGGRSRWAWEQLQQKGLDVYDAGSWEALSEILEESGS